MMLAFVSSFMVNISGPFYFQGVMRYTPSQVGLVFLIVPVVTVVASPVTGWLFDKRYWKHYGRLGMGVVALCLFALGWMALRVDFLPMIPLFAVLGLGSALFQSPNSTEIMNAFPREKVGIASSITATIRNLGMTVGTAVGTLVISAQLAGAGTRAPSCRRARRSWPACWASPSSHRGRWRRPRRCRCERSMKPAFKKNDEFLSDVRSAPAGTDLLHLWWLGQSGFLLQYNGRFLLMDPYLSDSLTHKYDGSETPHVRMTERVVDPSRLGFVEVCTCSHAHTDHMDPDTLRPLLLANPGLQVVVPESTRDTASQRLGVDRARPIGMNSGEKRTVGGFALSAVAFRA